MTTAGETSNAAQRVLGRALGADYGLPVLAGARVESARRLVSFILSPEGQAILPWHGFTDPTGLGG